MWGPSPISHPPIPSKLFPSTQPHLSLLRAALEDSHMSQASCQRRQLAWEERGKAHSRPGEKQAGPLTCGLDRVPGQCSLVEVGLSEGRVRE